MQPEPQRWGRSSDWDPQLLSCRPCLSDQRGPAKTPRAGAVRPEAQQWVEIPISRPAGTQPSDRGPGLEEVGSTRGREKLGLPLCSWALSYSPNRIPQAFALAGPPAWVTLPPAPVHVLWLCLPFSPPKTRMMGRSSDEGWLEERPAGTRPPPPPEEESTVKRTLHPGWSPLPFPT